MRRPRHSQQRMFYSIYLDSIPVYAKDRDGNIIYDTMPDGEKIPRETGEYRNGYTEPVEFLNTISGTLNEDEARPFGAEKTGMAKMTYLKGELPFKTGVIVWKDSPVGYLDNGEVDGNTADYRVVGVETTARLYDRCYLAEISH